jgi:hypothetical protein
VLERVLAELIADVAPAKHVELLFERAKRLRKQGKSVEAFGSLKPLLRSRADIDTAIDDEQRFFLALLSLEAAGEGLIRTTRTDDRCSSSSRLPRTTWSPEPRPRKDLSDEASACSADRVGTAPRSPAPSPPGHHRERPRNHPRSRQNKLLTGHLDEAES